MSFISNGDYNFPFDVHFYWMKLVYIWSYQTGSANPDGIIRMPARIIDLLVFALMGNIAISIFYLVTCLMVVFLSFYLFSKYFLKINSVWLSILTSLFFTINPIFLGNVSKIGLVLATAMLPLCFVVIQKAFQKQQLGYLLLWVAFLNISLIHPFTFTVNLLVSGGYVLYMALKNKQFIRQNVPKLLLVGLVGLLLNAYFLLPLASLGSVSKDVLSSNVSSTPTDYTSLINVANTGDIFTGLSLAKGVLKDYEFYNNSTQALYFLSIFSFYVILFGAYVKIEKKLSIRNRKYFAWSLGAFLILILLAAVNYLFVEDLIRLIVNLPGGWIFRSPLKWQLYIPFTIATMLALTLAYVPRKKHRIVLYSALTASFIAMNAFIITDISSKLLTPRQINHFGALQQTNLDQKNFLMINDESCFSFASENAPVMTELNQILVSKNVQVKQMSVSDSDSANLSTYDYVLGCQGTATLSIKDYDFGQPQPLVDNNFQLYTNQKPKPYVYTNQRVFALEKPENISDKYDIVTRTLGSDFDFIDTPARTSKMTVGLQDAYENVSFGDINGSSIKSSILPPTQAGKQTLYLKNSEDLNYKLADHQLSLTPKWSYGYEPLGMVGETKVIDIPHENRLNFSYDDPRYDSVNIFPNSSLEQGLWQKQVGDCYDYGGNRKVAMRANTHDKTNGAQSLQLEAQSHVACSGPNDIPVQPEQNYLLSFDYKSVNGRFAAYYVSFDDAATTSYFKRLDDTNGKWDTLTKNIVVPAGAHNMKVLLYAYPDTSNLGTGITRYDNFQLAATPNVQNHFYLVSEPKVTLKQPHKVSYDFVNPTKTSIQIEGASTPFYIQTKESYSQHWSLSSTTTEDHVRMNNSMNGWLIDPTKHCGSGCTKNTGGTYDMNLTMEFVPQRWLAIGTAISTVTFLVTTGYFIYKWRHPGDIKKYVMRKNRRW